MHIYVWDRLVVAIGPGLENARHRHFGATIFLVRGAPVAFLGEGDTAITCNAALIAPNAWRSVDARNARALTILVGADHPWYRYVKPLLNGAPIMPLEHARLERLDIPWDALFAGQCECQLALQCIQKILQTFGGEDAKQHVLDARIEETLRLLRESNETPTLKELANRVGLSSFTLMRRFKAELGVRISEYVLWRRLMAGLTLVDGQRTLTEIAQLTGFYDQAHLTHTTRRMVELTPSFITDFNRTRVHVCMDAADCPRPV